MFIPLYSYRSPPEKDPGLEIEMQRMNGKLPWPPHRAALDYPATCQCFSHEEIPPTFILVLSKHIDKQPYLESLKHLISINIYING